MCLTVFTQSWEGFQTCDGPMPALLLLFSLLMFMWAVPFRIPFDSCLQLWHFLRCRRYRHILVGYRITCIAVPLFLLYLPCCCCRVVPCAGGMVVCFFLASAASRKCFLKLSGQADNPNGKVLPWSCSVTLNTTWSPQK